MSEAKPIWITASGIATALYRVREALAEKHRREIQRQAAGGMPVAGSVLSTPRGGSHDETLSLVSSKATSSTWVSSRPWSGDTLMQVDPVFRGVEKRTLTSTNCCLETHLRLSLSSSRSMLHLKKEQSGDLHQLACRTRRALGGKLSDGNARTKMPLSPTRAAVAGVERGSNGQTGKIRPNTRVGLIQWRRECD